MKRVVNGLVCLLLTIACDAAVGKVIAKLPDGPEGLAVDGEGNFFASLFRHNRVVRLDGQGGWQHVAWIPSKELAGNGELMGVAIDAQDRLYVAFREVRGSQYDKAEPFDPLHLSCRDATITRSGVYRVDTRTGAVEALATRADGWPVCFPNDIAVDASGNIYVSDLTLSGIWKLSPNGKEFQLWSAAAELNAAPAPWSIGPIGVNVIELDAQGRHLFAATNGNPMVLRIAINPDGSAGQLQVMARESSPYDGIALDADGRLFVSEIFRGEIAQLDAKGSRKLIAAPGAGASPRSLVVWDGHICAANIGLDTGNPFAKTVACFQIGN